MTLSLCDQVAERVALGEPLVELTEHAATCTGCQRLIAMSTRLGAMHHAVDPGLGFSARMTVGAQHRIAARRRRRLAVTLAATVATGALGVLIVTRTPEDPRATQPVATRTQKPPSDPTDKDEPPTATGDDDVAALVQLADVDRASRLSAPWSEIKKPLAPYKKLLKGVTP